ncbi:MAG: Xaa-Pro peptidase family protein [Ignisphaera sp.]
MSLPPSVFKSRVERLQNLLREKGIDCAMIRTLSDFKYLVGVKWLRPALLVPSDGNPKVFVAVGEEEGFLSLSKLKGVDVVTYTDGGDLMNKVVTNIKLLKARRVGMVFGVERDAYILFYEMFKRANRDVEVVDIGPILTEMRSIKDSHEIEAISKAAEISTMVLEKTMNFVKEGVSELELAAEAYSIAYRLGSEEPHIYINIGPHPRVHAEPLRDVVAKKNVLVTIVVGADYNGYYANASASLFIGDSKPDEIRKAFNCAKEVYEEAVSMTKPGTRFIDVIRRLDSIYSKYGLLDKRIVGYVHGVGLQVEEYPITTIVPAHRAVEAKTGMVVAMVHSPLMLPGYGSIKIEDTFVIAENGCRKLSKAIEVVNWS